MTYHYFLKPNVIAEPLVSEWYAQPFLISPATAALTIAFSHLKIMASYINNPDKHHDARQWQALSGGHLMDENKNRLHDVQSLYLATLQDLQPIIAFAQGFKQGLQHISHRDPW